MATVKDVKKKVVKLQPKVQEIIVKTISVKLSDGTWTIEIGAWDESDYKNHKDLVRITPPCGDNHELDLGVLKGLIEVLSEHLPK